ncbi:MAG: ABC transporter permease, partial [Anaerolineae bacterium]
MLTFIIRRILSAIPTILVVITLVFFAVRGLGGDPAIAILGDRATPQALEAIRERLGLNRPLWEQYTS